MPDSKVWHVFASANLSATSAQVDEQDKFSKVLQFLRRQLAREQVVSSELYAVASL